MDEWFRKDYCPACPDDEEDNIYTDGDGEGGAAISMQIHQVVRPTN